MSTYPILTGREAILAGGGADPFVSCFVADDSEGVVADGAVVWKREFGDRVVVMGDGPAAATAGLIAEVADRWLPARITVTAETLDQLPQRLRPPEVGRWHWFYTRTAPPRHPAEADCQWFTADDYDAITSLLDEAFPNASKRPADTAGNRQWFGARDADGTIVACGMVTVGDGVGPMLGSIAVHPRARRRGLGSAVTSWVTRQLLDEGHPMCALGSYAGEEATHRLYRRLGYHDSRILASGNLRNCPN